MQPWQLIIIAVTLFFCLVMWAAGREKKEWNQGYCSECNQPWVRFDVDSQGGRGYKDANGHSVWISYPVDR